MREFAGVLLVDRAGRLLMQERDEHPVIDPERWGVPGGHLEPGEDPALGAARELEEETGVVLAPTALTPWRTVEVFHEAYGSLDLMHFFSASADLTDDDLECREGRQMVFVAPDRVRGLDLTASARLAVPAFLDSAEYAALIR